MMDNLMAWRFISYDDCEGNIPTRYGSGELPRPNLPTTTIIARDLIRSNEKKEKMESP